MRSVFALSRATRRSTAISCTALLILSACGGLVAGDEGNASIPVTVLSSGTRHAPGLDEDVTYEVVRPEGSGTAKRVRRADGRFEPISDFRAEEHAAYRQRFGTITPEVWEEIARLRPGEKLSVAVQFNPGVDWNVLGPELQSSDVKVSQPARAQLRQSIAEGAAVLTAKAAQLGAPNATASAAIPVIYVNATAISLVALSFADGVVAIIQNGPSTAMWLGSPVEQDDGSGGPSPPNSIADAVMDTSFNRNGYFGAGQKIGVVEGAFCGWFAGSPVPFQYQQTEFSFSTIHYEREPISCAQLSDCAICSKGLGIVPYACVDTGDGSGTGACIDLHASQCAGVIAASTNNVPQGASDADLYFPNGGVESASDADNPGVACQTEGISYAYDYLQGLGVTTASESFVCNPGDADGDTQDWFARYYGMSIFRAAGNNPMISTGVACRGLNMNCVGGNTPADSMWPSSTWINPTGSDREEPDFTALANSVDVQDIALAITITPNTNLLFTQGDGTSYAAPAMAGFAALLAEACGGTLSPRLTRAIMRTSAWAKNPDHEWAYSTPIDGYDHRDGAGEPTGDNALQFCPPYYSPTGLYTNTIEQNIDVSSGTALPSYVDSANEAPPDGTSPPSDLKRRGRVGGMLERFALNTGDRFRATFTWDSCPAMSGSAQPAITTDFDIFLCDTLGQTCLPTGASESFDDNVEGFDTVVPYAGLWGLYYGYYPSQGCQGQTSEPIAAAYVYGTASGFQSDPPPSSEAGD